MHSSPWQATGHSAKLFVKVIPGKWSKGKIIKIQEIITDLLIRHKPDLLALKTLHPSRSSDRLDAVICEIHEIAWRKGIEIREHSIDDLKRLYSRKKRINKRELSEMVAADHPVLFRELEKEIKIVRDKETKEIREKRLKKYYSRMFEAVALGAVCFHQMDGERAPSAKTAKSH